MLARFSEKCDVIIKFQYGKTDVKFIFFITHTTILSAWMDSA